VAALTTFKTDFDNARAATVDAGESATAAKNNYRGILLEGLRDDALYVEITAKNDLAVLLSSGYKAASTNRASAPLQQVEIILVSSPASGQLKVRPKSQPNVRSFIGRIKPQGGEYGPTVSFAGSRDIIFGALVAGLKYTLQLAAIGGSNRQSAGAIPWKRWRCDPAFGRVIGY